MTAHTGTISYCDGAYHAFRLIGRQLVSLGQFPTLADAAYAIRNAPLPASSAAADAQARAGARPPA